ncbi:hypothetical protein [Selenihalanaerobacter shriftii]|uniref:Uncharacterized protein n=1 Tax=Selenihalanaerobacter shriftii TaxID=142842 RepID=A0A1T4KVZ8_9FIRM|nr:hypothetical protein [Selenihalanaerobacter shriftii]SJZ46614.1 hypothetical protein SAMN02745118_00907 [Selenihalanaerobacter shriftii]
MSKKLIVVIILVILLLSSSLVAFASSQQDDGWWFPYVGRYNGEWEASVGAHFWNDHFDLRNLQLRANIDLAPGLRTNMVLRSNDDFKGVDEFDPKFDELYLEGYGFHYGDLGKLSASLKVGNMRYLRFPYPDLISTFDQVPGTEDLRFDDAETGYKGEMITLEYESKYGLGYHFTGINWDFGDRDGSNQIENYLFYRDKLGKLDLEIRGGELQQRPYPLGRSGLGHSIYLGGNWQGYKAGVLYEDLEDNPTYTGIMVKFAFSKITEFLGKVRFDYTRSPEGLVAHLPLLKGKIGDLKEEVPQGATLVGEVKAERVMTYWQNGQARNFYEHRISHWGDTNADDTVIVMKKKPWYLKLEALVSPNASISGWNDLEEWEDDRQGPAQLTRLITYQFYKLSK